MQVCCWLMQQYNQCRNQHSIHELPGPALSTSSTGTVLYNALQCKWISFIKLTQSDFKPTTYTHIFVCSGHFDISHFDASQALQYRHGLRTKPPHLLPDSVPHLKEATNPFPPDWFQTKETFKKPVERPPMPLLPHEISKSKSKTKPATTTTMSEPETAARVMPFVKKQAPTAPATAMSSSPIIATTSRAKDQHSESEGFHNFILTISSSNFIF